MHSNTLKLNFCLSKYNFKIVKTSDKSGENVYSDNEIIWSMKNHLQISKIKRYIAMQEKEIKTYFMI